ncbi:RNA polymerase sigma factor SigJ [Shimia sp.]|uniref:RNA polymerase sigma factor SigJ n=1 Tax=Shimia sp. TaxID=1954381 RepID=UPI003B8C2035
MTENITMFETERSRLFALSYRMLGERAAAEDVVQEVWLRFSAANTSELDNPAAWLRRVATNIAIDALRSARARRESYVGPWLPEPLISETQAPADHAFELAQECELALLWAMERLAPTERAAFVLREAFDADYADIAVTLGRSEVACRQMVSRAHKRLQSSGPRFDVPRAEAAAALERFFFAAAHDHDTALRLLAEDAIAISDGGAKVRAARRPLYGPAEIMQVLSAVMQKERNVPNISFEMIQANGTPAIARFKDGVLETLTLVVPNLAGQVHWIYIMRNPDKLANSNA